MALCKLKAQNTMQKIPVSHVLENITKTHSVSFNYESNLLKGITVFPIADELNLTAKLKRIETQTDLIFEKISAMVYTISKRTKLCGYIRDSELDQPLSAATITSLSAQTITDKNGYFEIETTSNNELITIRYLGYKTIIRQAKYFNTSNCDIISMQMQQESITPIVIEAYIVKGINKTQDWATSIDYKHFSLLPGLIESDVLQTTQALPGIISVDETVSNINIRGGSNDQNLILWDDIKMYQTGHFFGLISSFNPLMTQTADVITNGSDVTLSDGVSGTIHMQTEKQINSKFSTILGVNFLNAELFSNIPLGQKSSLQIASRKSMDEFVRTPTYEVYFDRITQDTEVENNAPNVAHSNKKFNFYDASLRWLYQPTDKDFIRFNFILFGDDLGFDETANLDTFLRTRRSSVSQNSMAFGLNYKRLWNDNFYSTLNIYETDYKLKSLNADVLNNQLQLQENIVSETSIQLNNTYLYDLWRFNLGYQFTETEITNLTDIDAPRFVRRDEEILREHSAFLQAQLNNLDRTFSIKGGIRANYLSRFNKLLIEPRLNLRTALGDHISIEAQGEFKHQSTSQIVNFQNDFLGIEKRRWQMTDNDSIPIIQSKQASLGVFYKKKDWLIDAKVYYKTVDGITTQSQSFTTKYEFDKEKGSYDAYGLEFLFRKRFQKFNSWLSYSYINNTYNFERLEDRIFPSNFDITHAVTFGTTFSNAVWDISAGLNYRTGKPTSVPLANNEIIDDAINFGSANSHRLIDYIRIDASAIYKLKLGKKHRSEIGVSLWNISNRENAINNYYRIHENESTIDKFSRFSLGLTTNAVVRLYF